MLAATLPVAPGRSSSVMRLPPLHSTAYSVAPTTLDPTICPEWLMPSATLDTAPGRPPRLMALPPLQLDGILRRADETSSDNLPGIVDVGGGVKDGSRQASEVDDAAAAPFRCLRKTVSGIADPYHLPRVVDAAGKAIDEAWEAAQIDNPAVAPLDGVLKVGARARPHRLPEIVDALAMLYVAPGKPPRLTKSAAAPLGGMLGGLASAPRRSHPKDRVQRKRRVK